MISKIQFFSHLVIFLNLALVELRLGLKNYRVGEKWILDDYLYKGLNIILGMRASARLFGLFLKIVFFV
ncbi:hypothetical protein MS2017_1803 [Bathymodiolus thermophilus thioautotrophic gill symbiont]|uniref:Uncharacterized protein n=1 Tax=Bathymodiolus thermophilus thioautotrophic gill symbiont TaxID=2360 RepID=A0A3G3INT4_9GAMM|nr:hypothetical protein MS2017_1803 [Bathymodiolus thermophilus thioautotrophic gill symbiont]